MSHAAKAANANFRRRALPALADVFGVAASVLSLAGAGATSPRQNCFLTELTITVSDVLRPFTAAGG